MTKLAKIALVLGLILTAAISWFYWNLHKTAGTPECLYSSGVSCDPDVDIKPLSIWAILLALLVIANLILLIRLIRKNLKPSLGSTGK